MMNNKFFEDLISKIKPIIGEKGSHDFSHTERVYKYAIIISKGLDVDLDIVKAAALLHDIARSKENKGKIKDHAAQGAIEARKILEKMDFPKEKIEIVCKCILMHNKSEDLPEMKEVRVLQEADGLDIMGAIGIARSFSYNGESHSWNISSPENPMNLLKILARLDYYKLPAARELAKRRIKIMDKFYNSFIKEYNMEI
jgi:uncharacterized protein